MAATSTFQDALVRVKSLAELANIDPEIIEGLLHPKEIRIVSLPVRMDNRTQNIFRIIAVVIMVFLVQPKVGYDFILM